MAFHFRQNSMFHFTLYFTQSVLQFVHVCHLSLHSRFNFFAFNIQLWFMQHSSFRFRHSTFHKQQSSFRIRPSSSVECTFIFSHPTFSICPLVFASDIRLWALYLQVSAFDIQLFELNFSPLVSDRWRSLAQLTWITPRSNGGRKSVKRLPSGADSGVLLHSRQTGRREQIKHGRSPGCRCTAFEGGECCISWKIS